MTHLRKIPQHIYDALYFAPWLWSLMLKILQSLTAQPFFSSTLCQFIVHKSHMFDSASTFFSQCAKFCKWREMHYTSRYLNLLKVRSCFNGSMSLAGTLYVWFLLERIIAPFKQIPLLAEILTHTSCAILQILKCPQSSSFPLVSPFQMRSQGTLVSCASGGPFLLFYTN